MSDQTDNARGPESEISRRLLSNVENLVEGHDQLKTQVNDISAQMKDAGISDFDAKELGNQIEKMQSQIEGVKEGMKKSPTYIPGLEGNEAKKFSLIRAMTAIRSGNWGKAGFEKEVFEAAKTKASQVAGVDSVGGYFVPDQVIPEVIGAIYTQSVLIALDGAGSTRVSVLDGLTGGSVKIPKFAGGTIGYWIGEEDEYTESQSTVGDATLTPKKLGVLVRLTEEMRRMQSYGFESLLRNDMVRAAAQKIDYACLYGTGTSNMPLGVANAVNATDIAAYVAGGSINDLTSPQVYLTSPTTADSSSDGAAWSGAAIADSDGSAFSFDDAENMAGMLEDANIVGDASRGWVGHPKFYRKLKQLKDSQDAYLIGIPAMPDARLADVIGAFGKTTQIPVTNGSGASLAHAGIANSDGTPLSYTDAFYGNWSEMVFGRWGGLEIEDDAGRGKGFTSDHTYLKLRLWCDIGYRHEAAIVMCPDASVA